MRNKKRNFKLLSKIAASNEGITNYEENKLVFRRYQQGFCLPLGLSKLIKQCDKNMLYLGKSNFTCSTKGMGMACILVVTTTFKPKVPQMFLE